MIHEHLQAPLFDRYEAFFTLGSFVMVPELLRDPATRQVTKDFIHYGLVLDDCWDFGVDRAELHGTPVGEYNFYEMLDSTMLQQLEESEERLYASINNISDERRKTHLYTTMERFKTSIMHTEALALAVPYKAEYWTPQRIEIYRATDTMIWAAMYAALKPHSSLELPDLFLEPEEYEIPVNGLNCVFNQYNLALLNSGKEGLEAQSLSWQMMYVQRIMDSDDGSINRKYYTPSFYVFRDTEPPLTNAIYSVPSEQRYLQWSKSFAQEFSLTRPIAKLFPRVYAIASNYSQWRSTIAGWGETYNSVTAS